MLKEQNYFIYKLIGVFLITTFIMISIASFIPRQFPIGSKIHITKDLTLSDTAKSLAQKNIISSPLLFKAVFSIFYGQKKVMAGDYIFETPQNLWKVIDRLAKGEYGFKVIKVTIPEGSTVQDIAWILLKKIPDFDAPYFVKIAKAHEGYLFPDTYRFYVNTTPDEVLKTLRETFNIKIKPVMVDVSLSGRTPADIVTMASLLEREASSSTDRAIISGILWKRLDEKMLLQVDATLVYLTGDGYVSINDTKIDSPYNTYKYKGLPKGPIANPGIDAIRSAANPVKTPYYYYLSDKDGNMHYAKTFEGHQENRGKYLRK